MILAHVSAAALCYVLATIAMTGAEINAGLGAFLVVFGLRRRK